MISPKVFDIQEQLSKQNIISHQQKRAKETLKYISIYRKVIRNNKVLSSSRTDLKQMNGKDNSGLNESDLNIRSINHWTKCSYADNINFKLVNCQQDRNSMNPNFTEEEQHSERKRDREKIALPILPK